MGRRRGQRLPAAPLQACSQQRGDGEGLRGMRGKSVPSLPGRTRARQAVLSDGFPSLPLPGTPTEDTWPGITSNEEFKAYNFTQYRAQPLINHAPRYLLEQGHGRHGGLVLVMKGSLGTPVSFPPCGVAASECSCARGGPSCHLSLALAIAMSPGCNDAPFFVSSFSQAGLRRH